MTTDNNYTVEIGLKFVIMNAIWIPIHLGWLWAGVALHRLNLSEQMHRAINIAMSVSMMTVVILAVILK